MQMIDPKSKSNLIFVSQQAYNQMQRIPTVDAEPVVRCKDCEEFTKNDIAYLGSGTCHFCEMVRSDDDFCSCGERRKNV